MKSQQSVRPSSWQAATKLDKRDIKDYLNMPERVMRYGVWVNIRAANQARRINR